MGVELPVKVLRQADLRKIRFPGDKEQAKLMSPNKCRSGIMRWNHIGN